MCYFFENWKKFEQSNSNFFFIIYHSLIAPILRFTTPKKIEIIKLSASKRDTASNSLQVRKEN